MGSIRHITRPVLPADPAPPSGGGDTLALSDLNYIGSYRMPTATGVAGGFQGWSPWYLGGPNGLTIRYEAGIPHLMTAVGNSTSGHMGHLIEWADRAPEIPVSPLVPGNYPVATMAKEYGNLYGTPGGAYKRMIHYDFNDGNGDQIIEFNNNGLTANGSIFCDRVQSENRLYWMYNFSYGAGAPSENEQWCIGYSDLDYASGTVTPHGPWRLSATQHKGCNAGMVPIPSAFIAANGLGSKRIGVIGSSIASTIAAGHFSFGPEITAFNPSWGAEQGLNSDSLRLAGYAPWNLHPGAGRDRGNRVRDWVRLAHPEFDNQGDWPVSKWCDQDFTYGGAWIHGANKSGLLTFGHMCYGAPLYISGAQFSEGIYHQLNIFSEADLALVAAGANPYDIQPLTYDFTALPVDYSTIRSSFRANIVSITANTGEPQTGPDNPGSYVGALVTTATPHGFTTGQYVVIYNSGVADYDNGWLCTVINSTQLRIWDGNHTGFFWSGTPATAGTIRALPTASASPFGTAYDPATGLYYIGWISSIGPTGMISVFEVAS